MASAIAQDSKNSQNSQASMPQVKMPEMPSISTSLQMPRISAPAIGGKFYTPGDFFSEKPAQSNSSSKEQLQNPALETNKGNNQAGSSNSSSRTARIVSSLLGSPSSLLNSSSVTAMDISNLSSRNLLGSLYNLNEDFSGLNNEQNTQVLLAEILTQLEEIKKQQDLTKTSARAAENQEKNPKILRFTINGSDILSTCRTIFFSKKENDGTFLLTADRKYDFNSQSRDETFYLLFKSDGNSGSMAGYNVQAKVVQDSINKESPIYKLSNQTSLHAEKTGNLVSLKQNSAELSLDLLLDIGD